MAFYVILVSTVYLFNILLIYEIVIVIVGKSWNGLLLLIYQVYWLMGGNLIKVDSKYPGVTNLHALWDAAGGKWPRNLHVGKKE